MVRGGGGGGLFVCWSLKVEIEVADQTFYLIQSQYTDTLPTSPSADAITPGAWQRIHWRANFEVRRGWGSEDKGDGELSLESHPECKRGWWWWWGGGRGGMVCEKNWLMGINSKNKKKKKKKPDKQNSHSCAVFLCFLSVSSCL